MLTSSTSSPIKKKQKNKKKPSLFPVVNDYVPPISGQFHPHISLLKSLFLEREEKQEVKERNIDVREKHRLVASFLPGPNPQLWHMPWPGMKLANFHFL